jgi:hypothetical protein
MLDKEPMVARARVMEVGLRTVFTISECPHTPLGGKHRRVVASRRHGDGLLSFKGAAYLPEARKRREQRSIVIR